MGTAGVSREQKNMAVRLALSCGSRSIRGLPLPPAPCVNVLRARTPAGTFSGGHSGISMLGFQTLPAGAWEVSNSAGGQAGQNRTVSLRGWKEEKPEAPSTRWLIFFFHDMLDSADFCVVRTRCSAWQLPLACSLRFSSRGKGSAAGSGQGKKRCLMHS